MIELGHLTDHRPPFRYTAYTRVTFSDTDAQGVAMRASGFEYHASARFDDLLEVFVRAERVGTTGVTCDHAAYCCDDDGTAELLMATAKQTLVLSDLETRRPTPVPASFRTRAAEFDG